MSDDARTWVERCEWCGAIRFARVVDTGDLVPLDAEVILVEQARADRWAHVDDCPKRLKTQPSLFQSRTA